VVILGWIGHKGADPEDKDEYKAENVFFVPEIARWFYLQSRATLPTIGKVVDNAMDAIEKDNSSLRREAQRGDQREFEEGEIGLNTIIWMSHFVISKMVDTRKSRRRYGWERIGQN
jgi:hypothetical protein